jgi:predicted membrane channel-forming protein YqfA (hemolysin III family)
MFEPGYLIVSLLVSSVGFVMFMYGKKQNRPVQFGGGLVLMIISFFVHDPLLLGLAGTAICALVWGGVKAGL